MTSSFIDRRRRGFTLVEMLVVISIIALLAAILLPTVNSARVRAKNTRARADMMTLKTAIEAYYNIYHKYPGQQLFGDVDERGDTYFSETDSERLVRGLIGQDTQMNPREIAFLELDAGGLDGEFVDPWGTQYIVKLDSGFDNEVEYYGDRSARILVISHGPNQSQDDPDGSDSDDLFSMPLES